MARQDRTYSKAFFLQIRKPTDAQQNQKHIIIMHPPENFSLLTHQASTAQQTTFNLQELKASIKQKESTIAQYSKRVEQKREEMKNLSKSVNTLIEKQLKKPAKQRPSFHVTYSSPRLNALRDEKNKIFLEIEHLKQQIKAMKVDHPQSIVNEVMANEAKMMQLDNEIAKAQDIKAIITKTLEENKTKLDKMKDNSCLTDIEKRESEIASIRKQCKQLEKEINFFSTQELQKSSFFFEMKGKVQKEIIEEKIEVQIDEQELNQLLSEINDIYERRRIVQTQGALRIKNQQKTITELEKNIIEKKVQIRELQNDVMRAGITAKRMHSMINLRGEYTSKKINSDQAKEKIIEKRKIFNPEEKKPQKRIINKIYMIQKDDAVYIGEWLNEAKPLSDKLEIPVLSIDHVKTLNFSLANGTVIAVKATYIDKNGSTIVGSELGIQASAQINIEINLEEVIHLEYSSKSQDFYIRFIFANGSWRELGQRGSEVEKINLEPYYVKSIEVLTAGQAISSLKLVIEEKIPEKLGLSDVAQRTTSQMSYMNFQSSVKKKVVLKGRSLKKIKEEAIVDHRLMLNKQR